MLLKRLIFDLGNVVLTNDWHDENVVKYQEFTDYYGISYKEMEKGWFAAWDEYKVGKMTEDEFWRRFLKAAGAKKLQINKAKESWKKHQQAIEGMLDILDKLRGKYKLAVLSNTGKEWLEFKKRKFNLENYFDVFVGSGNAGYVKPDMVIYKLLLSRIKEAPRECVFIDDNDNNLTPAKTLGIKVIKFVNRSQLERDLIKAGVKW